MARPLTSFPNQNQSPSLYGQALGINIPLNGAPGGLVSNFTTPDQVKANLINFLLTNQGERIFRVGFGANLKTLLFETISEVSLAGVTDQLKEAIISNFPRINLQDVDISFFSDQNTIQLSITYSIIPSSRIENINLVINGTN